ncbi:MAG TPA: hypothetical protein VK966_04895, partial [Longimicrobiales bacterium]|nr:hypothetical protein [Longimicrobiales bacterium]
MQDNRLKGDESTGPAIAALVADLMFAARIRGADPKAATVQRAEALLDVVGPGTRLVLVDLHVPGAVEAISRLVGRGTGTDDGDGAGPGGDFREGSGVH